MTHIEHPAGQPWSRQKRLRRRPATRALLLPFCKCGSAQPRQPTSSPEPKKTMLANQYSKRRPATRQQAEVCFAVLKRVFGGGETLAKTLTGLTNRITAKVLAYTYGLYVNRTLGRAQGRIKELWARLSPNTHRVNRIRERLRIWPPKD